MSIQSVTNINNEPFVLDDSAEVIDGITLAASQGDLSGGYAVLGEVSATPGTYKVVDYKAQDGSNIPKLILATRDITNDGSPQTELSGYRKGLFDENQLLFASGTDLDSRLGDELMPNLVDRDFSGASAWVNVDINAYDATGDLTLTTNAGDQYCTLPVASFPTEIGKSYVMKFDLANIVSDWLIKDFTGVQQLAKISATGTQIEVAWQALTTGGLRLVGEDADSSGDFDNFTLALTGEMTDLSMRQLLRMFQLLFSPGLSTTDYENA